MSLIYGAILIVSIIAIHEFGHYFIGKLFGIKFSTFCIGMGPRILKKRLGDTIYYISILPIGGYVRSNVHKEIHAKEYLFLRMGNFLAPVDKDEYELIKKHKSEVKVQLEERNPFGFIMYLLGGAIFNVLSQNQFPQGIRAQINPLRSSSQIYAAIPKNRRNFDRKLFIEIPDTLYVWDIIHE